MNVWTLRNKLKSGTNKERLVQSMLTPPPAPAPVAVAYVPAAMPAAQTAIPAVPTAVTTKEPETLPVAAVPEFIGLDQMFEVTDSELHAFSPNNTFTKLKKLHLDAVAS